MYSDGKEYSLNTSIGGIGGGSEKLKRNFNLQRERNYLFYTIFKSTSQAILIPIIRNIQWLVAEKCLKRTISHTIYLTIIVQNKFFFSKKSVLITI